jgi:hypothetical protein
MPAELGAGEMPPAPALAPQPATDEHPPTPVPEPEPPAPEPGPPAPEPHPPAPEPGAPPAQLRPVPLPPEPDPNRVPEEVREPGVAHLPFGGEPRKWNVWELERLAREDEGRGELLYSGV